MACIVVDKSTDLAKPPLIFKFTKKEKNTKEEANEELTP